MPRLFFKFLEKKKDGFGKKMKNFFPDDVTFLLLQHIKGKEMLQEPFLNRSGPEGLFPEALNPTP